MTRVLAGAALVLTLVALVGCGGGTKTVTATTPVITSAATGHSGGVVPHHTEKHARIGHPGESEAEEAKSEAEEAKSEAEDAKQEAEDAKSEAEDAKTKAEEHEP